tara:strand:+ start:1092 stop:2246 length:1155 start_codon:yes stop_codon:yes gene_type:complete
MPQFYFIGGTLARSQKVRVGGLSSEDIRKMLNKKSGSEVAYSLEDDNPTDVKEWVSTGSRWLDGIICKGKLAGIPLGKIVEIAGLESTGKSYMAAQIAANAQKKGLKVVYFDSESAIDSDFLEKTGVSLQDLIYVQAESVEFVLESIETIISHEERVFFIWDSVANTPCVSDTEGDFNPQSSMAVKARILSKGMKKLVIPVANANSTILALNQLKTNISNNTADLLLNPHVTPGGKALPYAYSLRIWLYPRRAKKSYVMDDKGYRVGSEVKARIKKSRFGTEGRECAFKIMWGTEDAVIQDEQSWLGAIKNSEHVEQKGAWYILKYKDGTEQKFQSSKWLELLGDDKFKSRILEVMDEEVIQKFSSREGDATAFYDVNQGSEDE